MEKEQNKWRLKEIKIKFEKGYDFRDKDEEKHDRYVGNISFENGVDESFQFNIPSKMTERYIELMSEDIIKCAESLGDKLIKSLNLAPNKTKD